MKKVCNKCTREKEVSEFSGGRGTCKECVSIYNRSHYQSNRETIIRRVTGYVAANRPAVNTRHNEYRKRNRAKITARSVELRKNDPERFRNYQRRYCQKNKSAIRYKYNLKRDNDVSFKILTILRHRIRQALHGKVKAKRTVDLLGCTVEQLRTHLAAQFKPGMTWENYGFDGWHIDHKIPCAAFDLSSPEEQSRCFHFTNLQPLWKDENFAKADKMMAA